ncbi:hypothetical protein F5J12DRAFT_935539 [Pisolithus orientalis]|uniref:uncharacterized protein n=1 Tax=Pisolithus orientalis TaxID=936130 RepID=UPI00222446CD|nr:uncharacterized protein F5J12DRAFT_935539 [Pisolithus orientalis]KAI6008777.1 hypothetical protein F5J12DRAFT_935539 [Pisolithus orientalis]
MMQWREYHSTIQGNIVGCVRSNIGLLLVMLSQVFFSFMNVAVKVLNQLDPPVPAFELVIVRMAITFICCEIYMIAARIPDPFLGPKEVRPLLVCRGVAGFFGLFGIYYALQYLSLGDVTVLTFVGPIFTGIAGRLFLGETYSKREARYLLVSLTVSCGAVCSLFDPELEEPTVYASAGDRFRATLVLVMGITIAAFAMIAIRAIGTRAHAMHSMAYFSLWSVIVSTFGEFMVYPTQWEWSALLLLIGVFGFIAQMCLTMGLQRETAARGTMGVYVQVIFANVLEIIFFKTVPSFLSLLGTGIIMTCAIYIVFTKQKQGQEPNVALESGEPSLEEGLLTHRDSVSEE